jgi:hypothetical protein
MAEEATTWIASVIPSIQAGRLRLGPVRRCALKWCQGNDNTGGNRVCGAAEILRYPAGRGRPLCRRVAARALPSARDRVSDRRQAEVGPLPRSVAGPQWRAGRIARSATVGGSRKGRSPDSVYGFAFARVVFAYPDPASLSRVGTPREQIETATESCGHLSLFLGAGTIRNSWPRVARSLGER